ncbi:MAG: ABC-2 transporter permease [Firmicutes bacterium]|nr:ABC-2 transporter permease [Bacillota bacterium]
MGLGIGVVIDAITERVSSDPTIFAAPNYVSMLFTMVALAFGTYSLTVGIQTPFFYKFGYKKGRIFMWIPLLIVIIVLNLPWLLNIIADIEFNVFDFILRNQISRLISSFVFVGVGTLILIGSFFLSRKMYLKKNI